METSDNMESWKADEKHSSRVVKSVDRRCNRQKVRRKKIHPREMLEKSRNAVFFQWFVCQVSRKVGLLKRRVRRYVLRRQIKNCTPLWRNAHFEVKTYKTRQVRSTFWSWDVQNCAPLWRNAHFEAKMYKTPQLRSTFWSWDVQKLRAAVGKRTFWSQNVQNTSASEHFLKLRCPKIARGCGETHILKSKCTRHYILGTLFEVQMPKNCTSLWREAHFQVKILKNWWYRSTFWSSDVEQLDAAVARSAFWSQNLKKLTVSEHFLKFWCRKIARRCSAKHISKSKF